MVYLFSGVLTVGVLTAICWPLFARGSNPESAILEETQWDLLQRKKEVILGNIQDLDFEFKCGKLSAEDHGGVRSELAAEIGEVFRALDELENSQDLDTLIRREVASRQKRLGETGTCAGCGHSNPARNKFCSECGAPLTT